MKLEEMNAAMHEAKSTLTAADAVAVKLATMLVGRLRACGGNELAALKLELRDFNRRTWRWKRRR